MKIKKKKLKMLHEQLGKAVSLADYYRKQFSDLIEIFVRMKREAGYSQATDIETIWKEVLEKARKYDNEHPEEKGEFEFRYIIDILSDTDGEIEIKTRCMSCQRTMIIYGDEGMCVCGADQDELLESVAEEYETYLNFIKAE